MTDSGAILEESVLAERFRVLWPLGSGAFGAVYACEDLLLGDKAAVKVLHRASGRPLGRFYAEYRALRRVHHPNVVAPRAFGRHGEAPFIAMDLVDGKPLSRALGPLPAEPRAVAAALAQLLDALAAVHSRGLVHRDLKPANALLTSGGHLWVLDFGAVLPDEPDEIGLITEGGAVGTIAYMSHEALRGETIDARADLYSVGVVAFELLAGRLPVRVSGTGAHAVVQVLRAPPARLSPFRPDLDPPLVEWVDRLLERDPRARFPDAAAALVALRETGLLPPGRRAAPSRRPAPAPQGGDDLPLLGRAEAMRAASRAAKRAMEGRGVVLAVDAEPGCGLTRYLREVRARLVATGFTVFPARADDLRSPGPAALAAVTRSLLDQAGGAGPGYGTLVHALTSTGPMPGPQDFGLVTDPFQRRRREGLDGWVRLLGDAARNGPVALLLDDLGRAPAAIRELARHVAEGVPKLDAPVLVVAAATGARAEVHLGRLDGVDLEELFPERGILGTDEVRAARALHEHTGGVPAAVAATLDRWLDQDRLQAVPGGFAVTLKGREALAAPEDPTGGSEDGPEDGSRLGALTAGARRLLAFATLLDPPFTPGLLARAAGLDEAALLAPLDELTEAGWLRDDPSEGRFWIPDPTSAAGSRAALSDAEVRATHGRVADALFRSGEPDARVAGHLHQAGRDAEAARAWVRAAALAFSAHDAAGAFEAASRAASYAADPEALWTARLWICRSARHLGELEAAGHAGRELLGPPPKGTLREEAVEAAVVYGVLRADAGDADGAARAYDVAEERAGDNPALAAEVWLVRAQLGERTGNLAAAEDAARRALAGFRVGGRRRGAARALHTIGASLYARAEYEGALAAAREALATWIEPDERVDAALSWNLIAMCHADRGEPGAAREALAESNVRLAEAGRVRSLAFNRAIELDLLTREGEVPLDLAQEVLRYASRLKNTVIEAYAHGVLARAGGLDGSPASAVRSARRAVDLYEKMGNPALAAIAEARRALAERARDRFRAADEASAHALALNPDDAPASHGWQLRVVRAWCALDPTVRVAVAREAREGALAHLDRVGAADPERRERVRVRALELCRPADALDLPVEEEDVETVDSPADPRGRPG